jgi:hypothetical protein
MHKALAGSQGTMPAEMRLYSVLGRQEEGSRPPGPGARPKRVECTSEENRQDVFSQMV